MNILRKNESEPAGMFYDDNQPARKTIMNNLLSSEHISPMKLACKIIT